MRPYVLGISMLVCSLLGMGLAFDVVAYEAPIHFGWLFADYPDPERPGHLKGVFVSTPALLVRTLAAIVLISGAVRLWRALRKADS